MSTWNVHSSKIVYQNPDHPTFRIREDEVSRESGFSGKYSYIDFTGDGVYVLAINQDQKIWTVKVDRYPVHDVCIEFPGGGAEKGEDPLIAAQRELQEEMGLLADNWQYIGFFYSLNGNASSKGHVFIARDLHNDQSGTDENEGISHPEALSREEIRNLIESGKFLDGQCLAAYALAEKYL